MRVHLTDVGLANRRRTVESDCESDTSPKDTNLSGKWRLGPEPTSKVPRTSFVRANYDTLSLALFLIYDKGYSVVGGEEVTRGWRVAEGTNLGELVTQQLSYEYIKHCMHFRFSPLQLIIYPYTIAITLLVAVMSACGFGLVR